MVYFAIVKSHLQYCNTAWGDASDTAIKPLTTMHNRIIRILTFAPFRSRDVQQYYNMLDVMNLNQIYSFEKGKFMYRLVNKKLPSNFEELLSPHTQKTHYNLRSSRNGNIRENFARTNYGFRMMQTSGARLWNHIPNTIRQNETLNIFVDKYKKYILSNQINSEQRAET